MAHTGALVDAQVAGVGYTSSGAGAATLTGSTSSSGQFSFYAGQTVAFALPAGSGGSVALASAAPSLPTSGNAMVFVDQLTNGAQIAQVLQSLNHGTAAQMDVSGLTLSASTVTNLGAYVSSGGMTLPSGVSAQALMNTAQMDALAASPSLVFVNRGGVSLATATALTFDNSTWLGSWTNTTNGNNYPQSMALKLNPDGTFVALITPNEKNGIFGNWSLSNGQATITLGSSAQITLATNGSGQGTLPSGASAPFAQLTDFSKVANAPQFVGQWAFQTTVSNVYVGVFLRPDGTFQASSSCSFVPDGTWLVDSTGAVTGSGTIYVLLGSNITGGGPGMIVEHNSSGGTLTFVQAGTLTVSASAGGTLNGSIAGIASLMTLIGATGSTYPMSLAKETAAIGYVGNCGGGNSATAAF